ncbi:MAG: tetratricopeptide repeat protein, partial [Acidobacteriota bacterium]
RRRRSRRQLVLALSALFAWSGSLLMAEPTANTETAASDLPELRVEGLEPAVQERLASEREALHELLAASDDPALQAEGFGELALAHHAHAAWEIAEAAYARAAHLAPEDPRWPHARALVLEEMHRLDEAEAAYRQALEVLPGNPAAHVYLGRLLLERGEVAEANALADGALGLVSLMPAALALKGQVALADDRPADAIEPLRLALDQLPEATRLHHSLALAYRGAGQADAARRHFELRGEIGARPYDPMLVAVEERKVGERLLLLRGRRAFDAGDFPAAVEAFRRALEAQPESLGARLNLGSALVAAGEAEEGERELRRVLEERPEHPEVHYNLGRLTAARGEAAAALQHFEVVLATRPDDLDARRFAALARRDLGDLETATPELVAVAAARQEDVLLQLQAAESLLALNRFAEAKELLMRAHRTSPNDGQLAHALARILAAAPDPTLRDGERALDLAQRVAAAAPSPRHLETLAEAAAEAGQCDAATEAVRGALRALTAATPTPDPRVQARLQRALLRYTAGAPCRPPTADG